MEKGFFKVYTFDFCGFCDENYIEKSQKFLSSSDFCFVEKQMNKKHVFQRVFSRVLIAYGLKDCGYDFENIKKDEKGKPFFEDLPLKIGISHSENRVCVFLSTFDGGIDIQKKKEIKNARENVYFSVEEIKSQQVDKFYLCKVFSKKECFFKYGKKIGENLCFTDFSDNKYFFFAISENVLPQKIEVSKNEIIKFINL